MHCAEIEKVVRECVVREEERKEWVENLGQGMTVVYTSRHVQMRRVGLLHWEVRAA